MRTSATSLLTTWLRLPAGATGGGGRPRGDACAPGATGLRTSERMRAGTLSYGDQRRVEIARALALTRACSSWMSPRRA